MVPYFLPSTHEVVHLAQELPQEMVQGLQKADLGSQGGRVGQQEAQLKGDEQNGGVASAFWISGAWMSWQRAREECWTTQGWKFHLKVGRAP